MELREQIAREVAKLARGETDWSCYTEYADAILAIPELADALAKRRPLVIDPGDYNPARKRIVPEDETFVKVTAT